MRPAAKDKIIIINATNIGQKLDGIGVYTLSLLRELSRLKTDINFIIFLNKNSEQYIRDIKFPENFSIKWAAHYISPDYGFKGHLLRLLFSNLLSFKYKKFLIFNTSQIEAMFFRSSQVITIHDLIPILFNENYKKQHYYYKYILKHALHAAKAIITDSNHTKKLIESFYGLPGTKIYVIYLGIQSIYLKETETFNAKRENLILYVGRITRTKNITGLLKAFELIKDKIDHKLVIVGSGKELYASELSRYVNDDRVIFKGYVPNNKLLKLYRRASLFVLPSLYEGFGLPPLEAMACGCPVVVSNVASLPEVCGDAAYYVDPYNMNSIAEGIYKVLTDKNLRDILIQKGLERVKLFSWEKSAKEVLNVFEEILK